MKNLFIIDGASGTGKSDLIKYVKEFHQNTTIIKKYTTRSKRNIEYGDKYELDLKFINDEEFLSFNLDYDYTYSGYRYGFNKQDLLNSLKKFSNVFIIIRNYKLIKNLTNEYNFINVVPVYIYTDKVEIEKRLKYEGYDDENIIFRLKRIKIAFEDFLRHPDLYDEIIINNSTIEDYHRLIDNLIEKYENIPEIDHKLIFVLMSFNPDNKALRDYYRAMKRAVSSFDDDYQCINLEEVKELSFKISDKAKQKIKNCRLTLVDLTENKHNVFYELGYVHGISKDCIITAHKDSEKHFYPSEYRVIYYDSATDLEEKLKEQLEHILN